MANPFDQFDQAQVQVNPFDQFDTPEVATPSVPQEPVQFGSGLTREDILSNPDYMNVIEQDLMLRQGGEGLVSKAARGTKRMLGASSSQMWGDMTPEEKFEMWQEVQRDLAAGQTVSLGNEVALVATLPDEEKLKLQNSYKLFDSMGNIFTTGTWDQTLEGMWDYTQATILDPTTLLGVGVGRAYSKAGSKAATVALREAVDRGVQMGLENVAKSGVKGATRVAAEAAAKEAGQAAFRAGTGAIAKQAAKKEGLAQIGTEFVSNVGKDILYQNKVLMPTGTQEEYSYGQTALAAIGTIALPAMIYGAKSFGTGVEIAAEKIAQKYGLTNQFATYKDVASQATKLTKDEITQKVKERLDLGAVTDGLKKSFENFDKYKDTMPSWIKAKEDAKAWLEKGGIDAKATNYRQDFYRRFLLGNEDAQGVLAGDGFYGALEKAGFVYVPRNAEDTETNFIADAIHWMDDSLIEDIIKKYEASAGVKLGLGYDAQSVAAGLKLQESLSGQYLNIISLGKRKYGRGVTLKDLEKNARDTLDGKAKKDPAWLAYIGSLWKRNLTAALSTTGANLIGFAGMTGYNTVADVVHAGLAGAVGLTKKGAKRQEYFIQAKGSLSGAGRRAVNLLKWDDTIKEAEQFLELRPDVAKELMSIISGDGGTRDAREFFNIGNDKWYVNALEKYTTAMQTVHGVILQDEITKLWGFMSNFDQAIMKEYGIPYSKFMEKSDWFVEMATDRFNKKVLMPTMERTQRETGSYTWSDKVSKSPALGIAKLIERVSNHKAAGFVFPFGRWFNTSTAFISDYTPATLFYNTALKIKGDAGSENINLLQDAAKMAVGAGLVALMFNEAKDRVNNGEPWNVRVLPDGTREDITNKFPENMTSWLAQLAAHGWKDGEIPPELWQAGMDTFFTNAFRTSEGALQELKDSFDMLVQMDMGGFSNIIASAAGNIVSGMTRPLDPVNKAIMIFSDDVSNPDRRQGSKWLNEATRYIDRILAVPRQEVRQMPTTGPARVDIAKTFSGIGTKAKSSLADKMFASIGSDSWKEIKWTGDPKVKNRMDGIISNIINDRARQYLEEYPDFFDKDLDSRIRITKQMVEVSKKDAKAIFESGVSEQDAALQALYALNQFSDKRALKWAKEALKVDDLAELVAEPGGAEKLQAVLDYATTYRDRLIK